jgi:diguanylate cyclase (GGDEF)-like protein/PAS domain S-box-containing protein
MAFQAGAMFTNHPGPVFPEQLENGSNARFDGDPPSLAQSMQHNHPEDIQESPAVPLSDNDNGLRGRLLDSLYDGVYFADADRKITYWNKGAERLTGYTAQEAIGRHCFDNFLNHIDGCGTQLCLTGCPLRETISDGQQREAEVFLLDKSGNRVPVSVRVSPIRDEQGSITGAVEIFSDNSAARDALQRLEKKASEFEALAYSDTLTGVANRRYIDLKVQQAIQEVELFNRPYGLILLDINDFKTVNDTLGHAAGDAVLKAICGTLLRCLRPCDVLGRWGGDEFVILARDVTPDSLEQLAHRCCQVIAETSIPVADCHVKLSVSLGPILLEQGESSSSAFTRADRLLYVNKCIARSDMR